MAIDRATFAGTDLDQAMQRMAQIDLNRPTSIMTMFNRSEEDRARNFDNVIVDNYHFDVDGSNPSTIAVATRAEKDDYDTPEEFSISQQTWKIDQGGENSFKMYKNDIRRSSRGRQRILDGSQKMRINGDTHREDNLVKYLDSLTTYTGGSPSANQLPKLDNSGVNGNAGAIHNRTIGTDNSGTKSGGNFKLGNAIDADGALLGSDAQKLATANAMVDTFLSMLTRLRRRNVMGGRTIGAEPGRIGAVMQPEVARAYLEAMKLLEIDNEMLNREIYRDAGIFTSEALAGTLFKIPFASSTAFPVPTYSNGKGYFDWYMMSENAVYYAEDGPYFWSQTPREDGGVNGGPYFSYHQRFEWGRKLVNAELIIKLSSVSAVSKDG